MTIRDNRPMDPGPSAASALETDRLCPILTTEENRVRTARSSVQIAELGWGG